MFFKIGVLKKFVKSSEKTFVGVLFITVAAWRSFPLKGRPQYRCFPVNFPKLLGKPFYITFPETASEM